MYYNLLKSNVWFRIFYEKEISWNFAIQETKLASLFKDEADGLILSLLLHGEIFLSYSLEGQMRRSEEHYLCIKESKIYNMLGSRKRHTREKEKCFMSVSNDRWTKDEYDIKLLNEKERERERTNRADLFTALFARYHSYTFILFIYICTTRQRFTW